MAELPGRITVFGGTGFVGRHLVRRLIHEAAAVRVATRHAQVPERGAEAVEAIPPACLGHKQR